MLAGRSSQYRPEYALREVGSTFLVVKQIDLRWDEKVENPSFALTRLCQWLGDEITQRALAEMCRDTVLWGCRQITPRDLRQKLEAAFRAGTLVVVRRPENDGLPSPDGAGDAAGEGLGQMVRGWRMKVGSRVAVVARRPDVPPAAAVEEPGVPTRELDSWLAGLPERISLVEMYRSVYGPNGVCSASVHTVKSKLAAAFERGELVMLRRNQSAGGSSGADGRRGQEEEPAERRPGKPPKTWIGFQLVDHEGEPVPDVRYRIRITDGSVREGTFGESGEIRIPNIEPGTCSISFPDLDASEWHPL